MVVFANSVKKKKFKIKITSRRRIRSGRIEVLAEWAAVQAESLNSERPGGY